MYALVLSFSTLTYIFYLIIATVTTHRTKLRKNGYQQVHLAEPGLTRRFSTVVITVMETTSKHRRTIVMAIDLVPTPLLPLVAAVILRTVVEVVGVEVVDRVPTRFRPPVVVGAVIVITAAAAVVVAVGGEAEGP